MDHSIALLPLNSGASIPQFGFGTYKLTGQDAYDGVRDALELGYRHIDTAQMYGNEAEVGRALADASHARRSSSRLSSITPITSLVLLARAFSAHWRTCSWTIWICS